MAKQIELTDDLQQDNPVAWLVVSPTGREEDYLVFADWRDAEAMAVQFANDEGEDTYAVYPLYAGKPIEV